MIRLFPGSIINHIHFLQSDQSTAAAFFKKVIYDRKKGCDLFFTINDLDNDWQVF